MSYKEIKIDTPDKKQFKETTSIRFKVDMIDFLEDKQLQNCLEIGTNWGFTTYTLSFLFDKVWTIEKTLSNFQKAQEVCDNRDNIEFINGDAYNKKTFKAIPKQDCVFIDCVHTFAEVLHDLNTAKDILNDKGYIILDDYGHPQTGVYNAVQHFLKNSEYNIVSEIGEDEGYTFKNNEVSLIRKEGVILSKETVGLQLEM